MTEEYIQHPIIDELPDHTTKLKEIKNVSDRAIKKYHREKNIGGHPMTLRDLENIMYILDNCLRVVAELSLTRNDIRDELKDYYTTYYAKTPALGRKLWINHYFQLHKPYDKVKNSIWKSIFFLKKVIEDYEN